MPQRIRRIGVLSAAKTFGILFGAMGLLFLVLVSAFSGVMGAFSEMGMGLGMGRMGGMFGIGLLLPVGYGIYGFVSGAVMAWLYNVTLPFTGGFEIELG